MRRLAVSLVCVALAARGLAAQCATGYAAGDSACLRAEDAVKTFHPLAGVIVSGGAPVLGDAATLGGFGHLALTARVNMVRVTVPRPDSAGATVSGVVPAPVVEAAVGVFRGIGAGLLAVDALGAATLLPTTQVANLRVDSGAPHVGRLALGLGYGVRVGVLRGALVVPSVSVSVMHRTLPRLRYGTIPAGATILTSPDDFSFDANLAATNVRVTAGMKLLLFDVTAGFGFDHYSSDAHLTYFDSPTSTHTDTLALSANREVLFLDAGIDVLLVKLVGEIGFQTGRNESLSQAYRDLDPAAGHVFGGVGVRFSF